MDTYSLNAYNATLNELNKKRQEISLALRESAQTNESEKVTALNKELSNINNQMMNSPFEFVENNSNNFYSLILLEAMLSRRNSDLKKSSMNDDAGNGFVGGAPSTSGWTAANENVGQSNVSSLQSFQVPHIHFSMHKASLSSLSSLEESHPGS